MTIIITVQIYMIRYREGGWRNQKERGVFHPNKGGLHSCPGDEVLIIGNSSSSSSRGVKTGSSRGSIELFITGTPRNVSELIWIWWSLSLLPCTVAGAVSLEFGVSALSPFNFSVSESRRCCWGIMMFDPAVGCFPIALEPWSSPSITASVRGGTERESDAVCSRVACPWAGFDACGPSPNIDMALEGPLGEDIWSYNEDRGGNGGNGTFWLCCCGRDCERGRSWWLDSFPPHGGDVNVGELVDRLRDSRLLLKADNSGDDCPGGGSLFFFTEEGVWGGGGGGTDGEGGAGGSGLL